MSGMRGWGLSDQHLAVDALVAFVDGELSPSAHDRAAAHVARCPSCAAETAAQRNARTAIRSAETPSMSPQLMNALRAIPSEAELPSQPDELALTKDGQLVTVNSGRKTSTTFGSGPVLGSSTPLGSGQVLGDTASSAPTEERNSGSRRTRQGASVVFSGLVLGTLAFIHMPVDETQLPTTSAPRIPQRSGEQTAGTLPASTWQRVAPAHYQPRVAAPPPPAPPVGTTPAVPPAAAP